METLGIVLFVTIGFIVLYGFYKWSTKNHTSKNVGGGGSTSNVNEKPIHKK